MKIKIGSESLSFILVLFISLLLISGCSQSHIAAQIDVTSSMQAQQLYNKILSSQERRFISFSEMLQKLSQSDIIFIGEKHDNQVSHQLEQRIFKSLYKKNNRLMLALEMFARDAQPFLDKYLLNKINERLFLIHSRPWPNYRTDYRPLLEFAKENKIKVLAMNAPRRILRKIVRFGSKVLCDLTLSEKQYLAEKINFQDPLYRKYFYRSLPKSHPMMAKLKQNLLAASILKDETMAETIVKSLESPKYKGYQVIVVNGMFHSNYGLAIPKRISRRRPDLKIKIMTLLPLPKNESTIHFKEYLSSPAMADYIIFHQ